MVYECNYCLSLMIVRITPYATVPMIDAHSTMNVMVCSTVISATHTINDSMYTVM